MDKIMQKYSLFVLIAMLFACDSNTPNRVEKTNISRLNSRDIEDQLERIKILTAEIKAFSELKDAEYDLFNVNGFSNSEISIPGASSWDYRFVVKVKSSDISKWKKGFIEVESIEKDTTWMEQLVIDRKNNWQKASKPQYFVREGAGVIMQIFEKEGIIFKRVVQN